MEALIKQLSKYLFWKRPILKANLDLFGAVGVVAAVLAGAGVWMVVNLLNNSKAELLRSSAELEKRRGEIAEKRANEAENQVALLTTKLAAANAEKTSAPTEDVFPVTYYAYSRNSDNDEIEMETFALRIGAKSQKVEGTFSGDVLVGNQVVPRTWTIAGFHRGTNLFLTFITNPDGNTPIPVGIGSYQLRSVNDSEYTGYGMGLSCRRNSFVECPYVLSKQRVSTLEARLRWPRILDNKCVKRDLTPDSTSQFSCGGGESK